MRSIKSGLPLEAIQTRSEGKSAAAGGPEAWRRRANLSPWSSSLSLPAACATMLDHRDVHPPGRTVNKTDRDEHTVNVSDGVFGGSQVSQFSSSFPRCGYLERYIYAIRNMPAIPSKEGPRHRLMVPLKWYEAINSCTSFTLVHAEHSNRTHSPDCHQTIQGASVPKCVFGTLKRKEGYANQRATREHSGNVQ